MKRHDTLTDMYGPLMVPALVQTLLFRAGRGSFLYQCVTPAADRVENGAVMCLSDAATTTVGNSTASIAVHMRNRRIDDVERESGLFVDIVGSSFIIAVVVWWRATKERARDLGWSRPVLWWWWWEEKGKGKGHRSPCFCCNINGAQCLPVPKMWKEI